MAFRLLLFCSLLLWIMAFWTSLVSLTCNIWIHASDTHTHTHTYTADVPLSVAGSVCLPLRASWIWQQDTRARPEVSYLSRSSSSNYLLFHIYGAFRMKWDNDIMVVLFIYLLLGPIGFKLNVDYKTFIFQGRLKACVHCIAYVFADGNAHLVSHHGAQITRFYHPSTSCLHQISSSLDADTTV